MKGIWFRLAKLIKEADWINCIPENIKSGVTVYNEYTRQDVTGTMGTFDVVGTARRYSNSSSIYQTLVYNPYNYLSSSGRVVTITMDGPFYVTFSDFYSTSSFTASGLTEIPTTAFGNSKAKLYKGQDTASVTFPSNRAVTFCVWR